MPGKYSHSVVLADYSSRGIINLPNDQHLAFLRSSPYPASTRSRQNSNAWSDRSPAPQPRAQSALAYTNRYVPSSGRVSAASRHVIVDDDLDGERLAESSLRSYHQRPSTSASNSRSLPNRGRELALKHLKESAHGQSTVTPMPDQVNDQYTPRLHEANKKVSQTTRSQYRTIPSEIPSEMPPSVTKQSPNVERIPQTVSRPSTSHIGSPKLQPAAGIQSRVAATSPVIGRNVKPQLQTSNNTQPTKPIQRKLSQETQAFVPKSASVELDFAGFSDSEEQAASYFENASGTGVTIPRKPIASTVQSPRRYEIPSPRKSSARALESRAKTYRSMSTEPSDSENMVGTGVSPAYSSGRLDSSTSISTISSRSAPSTARAVKHTESKKAAEPSNQDWKLPEIDEDGTFGPDFFTQGLDDPIPQTISDESVDSFLNRPLGTVSAGRDIDFSRDYDEESEADAACPPDIGRFRDDDVADLSFLQATKSSSTTGRMASTAVQTPQGKTGGFFARFRNRSKARG